MKEDILEQLVDDYLQLEGFFTIHNVKFRPADDDPEYVRSQDCVHSDVDVVGFHPLRNGPDRTWVVSCKSWQMGFNPRERIKSIETNRRVSGREAWRGFRELAKKKWADALIREIKRLTGSAEFKYITAVTRLRGDPSQWQEYPPFKKNLRGNPIVILTLNEMLTRLYQATGTTEAPSEVGRLLQVIKASDWKP
jgi:hypothetical protein